MYMAEAKGHRWGQIIGDVFEEALKSLLVEMAKRHGLYLDYKRPRAARANASSVEWADAKGNRHRLDYVFERGGSEKTVGSPAAFIETAWRRYTKHSKNKAQEIDAAVTPLAEAYGAQRPFLGAVLAGDFTEASLRQLKSRGFHVVHVTYELIVAAFAKVGVDARFDEGTSESEFKRKIRQHGALTKAMKKTLMSALLGHHPEVKVFLHELERTITRAVERVRVLALHGAALTLATVTEAISYVGEYEETEGSPAPLSRYELRVEYTNGDAVEGVFGSRADALAFLRSLGPA